MAKIPTRLLWIEHHHVDLKRNMMDHHVDEAAFEAHLVVGQNIARETLDRRWIQIGERRDGQTGQDESVILVPVTEEALRQEVVEATLAGTDQLRQHAREEAPVRPFQCTTPDLKVRPTSMGLQLVEDIPLVVAGVIGTGIEAEVHSWANEIVIFCHLAVGQEKILPLEIVIVIVDETWTLTARIARTDGSLM
jgi:hypothetical protein